MPIATRNVPMPPKSSPERSSELRKALTRIKPDSTEAVLLFPDENASLSKLRNRASGAVSALKKDGLHFVTRTTSAVEPGSEEGAAPVKCVGIWKLSKPEDEGTEGEAKTKTAEQEADAPKPDAAAKPANPKASAGTAAKSNGNGKTSKQGDVLDGLGA